MRIQNNNYYVEIKRAYKDLSDAIDLYGEDYEYEDKYYLKISNKTFCLMFYDLNNTDFIINDDFLIIINNLKFYLIKDNVIEKKLESYYLGSYYRDNIIFLIFQTFIMVVKDKKISEIYTDFINDYYIKNSKIIIKSDDKMISYDLDELIRK